MRSVVVVLPASMWAMIPMFRTRSSAIACCVTATESFPPLPAIVREGLVGLRHPVDVVLLLECAALLVDRVEDLTGGVGPPPPPPAGRARTGRASERRASGHGAAAPRRAPGSSPRRRGEIGPRGP